MRVAIAAKGYSLNAEVDQRFGRARHFLIVDTEQEGFEAVDNQQNVNAAQGAGIQAAQNVASRSVEAVVTGHCGPKAFRTLRAANIKIFVGASGTVKDAIEKLRKGELREATAADVDGHW